MKSVFYSLLAFACLIMGFTSCETTEINEDDNHSNLTGIYVLQQVTINYANGKTKTYNQKKDFSSNNDNILFDYQYVFEKNGTYSFQGGYDDELYSGCTYKIKNGVLNMSLSPLFNFEMTAYKIVSNSGGTLILEPTDAMLDLNNDVRALVDEEQIKKTTGTYQKQ